MTILHTNTALFLIIIALVGLGVGSFLNVIIYRLPVMIAHDNHQAALEILNQSSPPESVINLWRPRSFCPKCRQPLPIWANLPIISYLVLQGRAQCCWGEISYRYFIIEILTGTLSLLLALHFGLTTKLFYSLILTWGLLALSFIDLDTLILPDQITLPLLWIGFLCNIHSNFTNLTNAVLGAVTGYVFFFIIAHLVIKIRKKQGLGGGDIKLIAMLGAWFGWQLLPAIIFIASFTGALFGIIHILKGKQKFTIHLPFGPFLALAGFLTLLFREQIVNATMQHIG